MAFALEAFVHLYAAAKNLLFSTQSNKKSVKFGTLPVYDVGTKHLVKFYLSICLETCKNLYGKNRESEEFVWKYEGCLKKNEKHIWKIMNWAEKVKEIIWQKFGKVKNLYGNEKDF